MIKSLDGNVFVNRVRYRLLKQNKNWIAIVCGETGSGKSYSAIALADAISPNGITIKSHVVFSPVELLQLINNPEGLEKGSVVVFDEAGVGMSAREWNSVQNKIMGNVLQTFRNLNIGLIFTTPNLSFMDVQGRKLLHNYFDTALIDYNDKCAWLKVYDIQVNSRLDKIYYKHPKIKNADGILIKVTHMGVPMARAELIADYERIKTEFTKELNKNALLEMTGQSHKDNRSFVRKDFNIEKQNIISEVLANADDFKNSRNTFDWYLIKGKYNISEPKAKEIKALLEKRVNKPSMLLQNK